VPAVLVVAALFIPWASHSPRTLEAGRATPASACEASAGMPPGAPERALPPPRLNEFVAAMLVQVLEPTDRSIQRAPDPVQPCAPGPD